MAKIEPRAAFVGRKKLERNDRPFPFVCPRNVTGRMVVLFDDAPADFSFSIELIDPHDVSCLAKPNRGSCTDGAANFTVSRPPSLNSFFRGDGSVDNRRRRLEENTSFIALWRRRDL